MHWLLKVFAQDLYVLRIGPASKDKLKDSIQIHFTLLTLQKHFLTSSCFSRIVEISVFGFLSITVHWCFYLIYYTVDISQSVCVKNFNPLYIFTMSNEQCLLFLCYLDWEIHIYLFCRMMDFASFCQHLSAPGLSWKLQNVILHFCMPCTRTVWSKKGC